MKSDARYKNPNSRIPETRINSEARMTKKKSDSSADFADLRSFGRSVMLRYSEASSWLGKNGQMLRSTSA